MLQDYFEPVFFYRLAKELNRIDSLNCEDSAIERTIIDRLYYSVFLAYKDYLTNNYSDFVPNNTGEDHFYIPNFIKKGNVFGKKSFDLANTILQLRTLRGEASYNLYPQNPYTRIGKTTIEEIFDDSEYLFEEIGISY